MTRPVKNVDSLICRPIIYPLCIAAAAATGRVEFSLCQERFNLVAKSSTAAEKNLVKRKERIRWKGCVNRITVFVSFPMVCNVI